MRTKVTWPNGSSTSLNAIRDHRRIRVGGQRDLGAAVAVVLGEDLAIEWGGQIAIDGVEEGFDALVAIGRAHHHRADLLRIVALADRLVDQLQRDLLLFQEQRHDRVGKHRERLEHPLAGALGGLGELGRDRLATDVLALVAVEVDGLAVDQVDHAGEARLGADRDLSGMAVRPSLLSSCWITLAGLAPVRSILLMNAMRGTCSASSGGRR